MNVRTVLRGIVVAILAVGCGSDAAEPAVSAPEITAEVAAELSARALDRACALHCGELDVYVRDSISSATALVGEEIEMDQLTRTAIAASVDVVEFVTAGRADELVGDSGMVDPTAVMLWVAPAVELGDGVVGADVGVVTAHDGFRYETHQFSWSGASWELVTAEETGIPVTTAVS